MSASPASASASASPASASQSTSATASSSLAGTDFQPPKQPPTPKQLDAIPSYSARNTKIFKAIIEFTDQLNDTFGKEDVNIVKVFRIINKTPLTNRKVIDRHLVVFHDYLDKNRAGILARNADQFTVDKLQLTERIFMDLKTIILNTDEATRKVIWQHLLNILYLYNPQDETVRTELKVAMSEHETKENKFLMDTFSKFEKTLQETKTGSGDPDPMAMVSGLMQSGFLNEMIGSINSGVNSGSLDIKSLIGTVQNMLGNLSETIEKEEKGK